MKLTFDNGTVQSINGTSRYVFEDISGSNAKMYPYVNWDAGSLQLQADNPLNLSNGKSYRATTEPTQSGGIIRNEVNTMIIQNAFTIEAWIKPTDLTSGYSVFRINPTGPSGSNEWSAINLSVQADGQLVSNFIRTGSAWETLYSGTSHVVPTNAWTHVAAVYDRDNDHISRLYINGTQVSTLNVGASYPDWSNANFRNSSSYNTLGCATSTGTYGYIDDLLLANHGRTDAEIAWDATHSFTPVAAAPPTFSVNSGLYFSPQTVTISCTTPNATIHYTTDGTDPADNSTTYTGPITVSQCTTLKAMASATGYLNSTIQTATYYFASVLGKYIVDDAHVINGTYIRDVTGNGHDANFFSTASLSTDGPFPGRKSVQTTSNKLVLSNPGTIDMNNKGLNQFTVQGWFKANSFGSADSYLMRINLGPQDSTHWSVINLAVTSAGTVYVQFIKTGNPWHTATAPVAAQLQAGQWYHIAGIYNRVDPQVSSTFSDGIVRLYVNGVLVKSDLTADYLNTATWMDVLDSPTTSAYIGGSSSSFDGWVSEMLIANYARTAADIQYDAAHPLSE